MSQSSQRNNITLPRRSQLARHYAKVDRHRILLSRGEESKEPGPAPSVETNIEELREHLQAAMMIELSTVPPYLYALYSVRSGSDAIQTLRSVVYEEMLHLTLAGNTLLAVGGQPKLYPRNLEAPNKDNFPVYPMDMSDRYPYVCLTLRQLDEKQRNLFIDIERRDDTPPSPTTGPQDGFEAYANLEDPATKEEYESLGDFYRFVQELVKEVGKSGFQPGAVDTQISSKDGIYWGPGLTTVQDPPSAIQAMQTIIDQGEGATEASTDNHLYKFQQMKVPEYGDVSDARTNPHTSEYKNNATNAVSTFFDAAYCYLLLSIEYLWQTPSGTQHRVELSNNIFRIMIDILRPTAQWLFRQPYNDGSDETAGPCFDVFKFQQPFEDHALNQFKDAAKAARTATPDLDIYDAVGVVLDKLVNLTAAS